MKLRQLVSSEQRVKTKAQHKSPCSDCPWSRKALRGWLGSMTADQWIAAAHGEATADCHTTDKQCAGMAIYRANVCKLTWNPRAIQLPPNHKKCFSSPMQFKAHHEAPSPPTTPNGPQASGGGRR